MLHKNIKGPLYLKCILNQFEGIQNSKTFHSQKCDPKMSN